MSVEFYGLIFTGAGICGLIWIALRAEKRTRQLRLEQANKPDPNVRLTELEHKLKYLQDEDIRKGQMIATLQTDLVAARERIRFLEGQIAIKNPVMAVIEEQPLMVVIGDDPALVVDLAALRGVKGLRVTRLLPATYSTLKSTVERFRRQGKPLEYLHFAVHATATGIELERSVKREELSELLRGCRIAVFMGCVTAEIGDLMTVIPAVVAFREPVPHDEAWQFSLLFWRAIGEGLLPARAFERACDRGPTGISEFAELVEM
jgi:hypothetical protein